MTDHETALRELLAKGSDATFLRDLTTKCQRRLNFGSFALAVRLVAVLGTDGRIRGTLLLH